MDVTIPLVRTVLSGHSKKSVTYPSLKPAGVLVVIYPKDGELHVLLNIRSQEVEDHKGEISFPGGRKDDSDSTMLSTALREAEEEIGILPDDVDVVGELDDVPTISSYLISPFVGIIPEAYEFKPNRQEVSQLLEVPMSALIDEKNLRDEMRLVEGKIVNRISYAYDGHLIYGATAMVLSGFLRMLKCELSGSESK